MGTPEVALHLSPATIKAIKQDLAVYRANDGKYAVRVSDGALVVAVDGTVALVPEAPSAHCCQPDCNTKPTHSVHVLQPRNLDEVYGEVTACPAHVGALLPEGPASVYPLEG